MLNSERGATFVEAAIVFPLLALILFGIVEYGYMLGSFMTLRNASAVAARAGTLYNANDTDIRAAARAAITPMLDAALLPDASIAIARDAATPPRLTVTLTYTLPLLVGGSAFGQAGAWQLSASSTMR